MAVSKVVLMVLSMAEKMVSLKVESMVGYWELRRVVKKVDEKAALMVVHLDCL